MITGIVLCLVVIWILGMILGYFDKPPHLKIPERLRSDTEIVAQAPGDETSRIASEQSREPEVDTEQRTDTEEIIETDDQAPMETEFAEPAKRRTWAQKRASRKAALTDEEVPPDEDERRIAEPQRTAKKKRAKQAKSASKHTARKKAAAEESTTAHSESLPADQEPHETEPTEEHLAKGVAFVKAAIKPLEYELTQRWWGWRPNDILDFTDNVNNYQLGVLEVTRRTAVSLAERLSRTGAASAFDRNLEQAMNWFMIKPDRYWFPSPESKYKDGLKELKTYMADLEIGEANFYTRTDNLIPLLASYEDLLGSCDDNLVKLKERGNLPVSYFKADDYFFYAKGVASAMLPVLEAVHQEFHEILESRRGAEVLHHAIESCRQAAKVDPWLITDSSLSGVFANHRANMAAPISHARFYVGLLIKTLST
jgi:hypothetical protein